MTDLWLFKSHYGPADLQAVARVLERETWWSGGEEVEAFESIIADYVGCDHGIAVNAGTSALLSILLALDVAGGEVIVPSFTYPATAQAVVGAGAKPVFADIEGESLGLDPDDVERKISHKTRAILPVHFAGAVCSRICKLIELSVEYDIPIVEDACHSLGASYLRKRAGSFGVAGAFSFAFNKLISTGEGGMVVTDSDYLAGRIKAIRAAGKSDGEYASHGLNFRMPSMLAALGLSQFSRMDDLISLRDRAVDIMNAGFQDLADREYFTLPTELPGHERVYLYYNLRFPHPGTRSALQKFLAMHGVPSRVTYEPVHLAPYYQKEYCYEEGDLPVTEHTSKRILTLPLYPQLTNAEMDFIVETVRGFFE